EGALFKSRDHGRSWTRLDLGPTPRSTVFAIAIDARRPDHIGCVAKGGELWLSRDRGATWHGHPLPSGAAQVYAIALGQGEGGPALATGRIPSGPLARGDPRPGLRWPEGLS